MLNIEYLRGFVKNNSSEKNKVSTVNYRLNPAY